MKKQTVVSKTPTEVKNSTKGIQFNHPEGKGFSTTPDKTREAITAVCAGRQAPKKPVVLTKNTSLFA